MLKLVVVGCGKSPRLTKYVNMLQNDLHCFAKQYGFFTYNTNKIYSSEGNFDALKKASRFYFPSRQDTSTEYWGIVGDANLFTYYSRWFKEKVDSLASNIVVSYNNTNLKKLVNEWLDNPICVKNSCLFDLKIKYQYIKRNDQDACLAEVSLNNSGLYPIPEDVFLNIIVKLDEFFSDVFMSAYVTDEPTDIRDAFYQAYHYNIDLLDSKILDVGYMLYVSRNIEKANSFEMNDGFSQYTANLLSNGTLYKRKKTIDNFEDFNNADDLILDRIVIPRYRVFNWSDLCYCKFFSISVCELISVYYDAYSPNDPTVVFSYGYSPNQLDDLPMLYDLVCQERYTVKGLIISK